MDLSNVAVDAIRPDRVAIYIRWSTEEQTEGTTLAEQREGCEHYLRSQGWFVNPALIFIDDGYSGGSLERPGMRQLRDLVLKSEVDCVVVFKIDRLSRNIVDATTLVLVEWKERCHLRCVRQPIDTTSETGRMIFSILATFADFERSQIVERTHSGYIRRMREGRSYGSRYVPFGLKATGTPGERELDQERAPIVAEMFRKVREEGATPQTLALWLYEQHISPPNRGKTWRLNTIRQILSNPIYAGRLVYGRTVVKKSTAQKQTQVKRDQPLVDVEAVAIPAIVSQKEFDEVQAIVAVRSKFHKAHRRASDGANLLTGIARCACGGPMCVHFAHGKRYYWCVRRSSYGPMGCTAETGLLRADAVEESIVAEMMRVFGDRSAREAAASIARGQLHEQARNLDQEKARVESELSRIDTRLMALRDKAGLGEISLSEWRDLREGLEHKRARAAGELADLEAALQKAAAADSLEEQIMRRMSSLDRWQELSPGVQKEILKDLVESLVLFKPKGSRAESVSITWRYAVSGAQVKG